MSLEVPVSAQRLVERHFGAARLNEALALVAAERVHVVKPPPWPVVARVQGHVVTVHYRVEGELLRGECSCDVAECAHAAATALAVLARERVYAAAQVEAARQAVVGEWLAELGRLELEPEAAAAPGSTQAIGYVLDGRDGDVGLTVVQCARLRSGLLAPGLPMAALADPQRGAPRWVEVDDLRRIAMLRAVTRAMPQVARLRFDRIHRELVEELAATGRLYWERTDGAPLAWGPARVETLRWQPVGDAFRLALEPPRLVAAARTLHYVDPAAHAIGRLELGLPAELVQRLVTSPPVPGSMRATVERSLRPLLPAAATIGDGVPAAEVWRARLSAGLDPDDRNRLALAAEASYGDERYRLAVWEADRPAARDLVGEGRARARLDRLLESLPHPLAAATSLQLLANARTIAHAVVPKLRSEGWQCVLDDSFPLDAPAVDAQFVEQLRAVGDGSKWFSLELGVTIEGRTVPLLPILLQAIRSGQIVLEPGGTLDGGAGLNLRLPEGELVYLPGDRLARWLRPLVELELAGLDAEGLLKLPTPIVALQPELDHPALAPVRAQLDGLLALTPADPGPGFVGTLRPYQRLGLAWLRVLHEAGLGGLLADDMGLGKTVQVLAFLDGLRLDDAHPALVVAPRSVVGNWAAEARRFAPSLRPAIHLGADRPTHATDIARAPLVITSYQTLARDLEQLRAVPWTTIFFDEAQAVKNPETQLRSAAAALGAHSRFCVTGTPIENHLGELWSQLDLAVPGLLGRRRSFDAIFRKPIERHAAQPVLDHLRQRIRPFLLRRSKQHVELDLPPRTEIIERVELDVAQRDLYESLRLSLDAGVRKALDDAHLPSAAMKILDALLKLRQCCCDPRLIKLPEARRVEGSAKLERLMGKLEELHEAGRTTLVFSQFTSMLALIERACAAADLPTLKLTGQTRDREDVIRRFQTGAARIFLVSLKAGGVGLNLTAADTVIHYDPWWNPAAEAQATDRAHRIGQDQPVVVYKLVARGTVEDAICALQDDKRRLTAAALRDGGVTHLAADDLRALYQYAVAAAPLE